MGNEGQVSYFLGGMVIAHALQEMVDAHVQSILLLAMPFRKETPQAYHFEDQREDPRSDSLYTPEQIDATTSRNL
jgi:hypothetical protein